jgi:uncharacterized membrane protein
MMLKIFMLINLLGYAVIAGQAFFYLVAMSNAQKNLQGPAYVELRNLLDRNLAVRFRIVYYTVLVSSIAVLALSITDPAGLVFITAAIAVITLWTDVILNFKGNAPINKAIRDWTPQTFPANWQDYRTEWFRYYQKRQALAIVGFVSLVVGAIGQ